MELCKWVEISEEIQNSIMKNGPVVALESTIISHGMPFPQNLETAMEVERIIRKEGAIPATDFHSFCSLSKLLKFKITQTYLDAPLYNCNRGRDCTFFADNSFNLQSSFHVLREWHPVGNDSRLNSYNRPISLN